MRLPIASPSATTRRTLALLKHHGWALAWILLLQLAASVTIVALPWIIGDIVDGIAQGQPMEWVRTRIIIAVVMAGVNFALVWLADSQARILGEKIFADLREKLVDSVVHLPLSAVESAGSGDLVGRTTHDIDRVQVMIRQGLSAVLVLLTTTLVTLIAAVLVEVRLAWILFAEIPLVVAVASYYMPRTVPAYRASSAVVAEFSGVMTETVSHAQSVDALNLGELRGRKFDALLAGMWRLERYGALMRTILYIGMIGVTLGPILLIIVLGAAWVPDGIVTAGAVTTMVMYCYQLRNPLWEATYWVDELQFAFTSLQRIFGVADVPADRTASDESPSEGEIHVEAVDYEYRAGKPVLHDVSLSLRPGETLAIVGPSGAGKSTLGRMIAGIHPPTRGRVTVDGVDLVNLPEDELHRRVVLVTQEHHVFVGTIADNLRLAVADADEESLWAALESVGAAQWVRDEGGLDMRVGEGGAELAPSRAQQIALARIVLMDPHTLVLDEATSLLDPASAKSVERSLAQVLRGRTVVAIAHRLHTAHDADRVAVMVDGQIAELGAHDELVALGGHYSKLWEAWQKH
ncbi:ABC transporter ATP-binding protein [Schaalia vaccimaxillae]|uniref:ABC transporter ATP-binding protein n=1 Tax=Schaalia vaccimaxillae TaxID=183916 RepID=UPI0003B790C2|nr:ABC transporter ATP-binding protein [Schaalia vaccimaxillae]